VIQLYSDVMQKFRLAAQGKRAGRQPPDHLRERVERYFDPLPFWYEPLESAATDRAAFSAGRRHAAANGDVSLVGSQNAWLRQIHGENYLFMNPLMARGNGIEDGGWIYVESQWGKVRCMARYQRGCRAGHGVDLECDRQGGRGMEPRARCQ
jgi:anaerobic selenocysteine-containing dehydrogenase